jgi:aryl-phospho-beta-D-glucosidase BglC (GH1 family)
VTAQGFQDDSVALAKRYAGNSTVIGFDLDNEPVEGVGRGCNWGQGGPTDILAMFENVGNAIQAVNPGVLIICEGPVNQLVPRTSVFHNTMDLTYVATKPVVLAIPNKVVYSPHEYPNEVSGTKVDSGPAYIDRLNRDWGYIVSQNVAPIWIGEMGAGLGLATDKDGQDWIAALLPYINGKDGGLGGPTFKNGEQPISTDWWMWGYNGVPDGWGTISQWHPAVFVPATRKVTNQLLFK